MEDNNLIVDTTSGSIFSKSGIIISPYAYGDTIDLDLSYVNKDSFKRHLKENPELLNEIISELRKEKIDKIKRNSQLLNKFIKNY